jgi:SAM-dependent methyltransferase
VSEPRSQYRSTDGAAYQIFLGRWTERLAEAFARWAELPADGTILDVGCGTGSLAAAIAQSRPTQSVVGLDIAEPYIDYARQHRSAPNLTFAVGEASRLDVADASVAATLAQLVLTFVPDARQVAKEMARVTRPGGVVATVVWDFCGGLVYQRLFWDTAAVLEPSAGRSRDRLFSHPLSDPAELGRLWSEAGLVDVSIGSLTVRMDYASFDDYWEPLLGGQGPVGTFVSSLDAQTLGKVQAAVRSAYLSGRPDGPRSLTATAWGVRGTVPKVG